MKNKKQFLGVCILTAMMAPVSLGCGTAEEDGIVEIMDYVTVDFTGADGEGIASVNVDYDGLETEMVGGEDALEELDSVEDLEALTTYINVVAGISFSIDENTGLSNGDQVTVTVTYDEDAAEAADVVFGETLSKTFEVTGLE